MNLLTKDEYLSTMGVPMQPVAKDAPPPFDFWSYFEKIPVEDFHGHDCSAGEVDRAWTNPSGKYQHVLIKSADKNVFMVLILDVKNQSVFGHHLLDLNDQYGIKSP